MGLEVVVVHGADGARAELAAALGADPQFRVKARPAIAQVRPPDSTGAVAVVFLTRGDDEDLLACTTLLEHGYRLVVTCPELTRSQLLKLLGTGCHAIVHPKAPTAVLRWAVRSVAHGSKFIGAHVSDTVIELALNNQRSVGAFGLSIAERNVLRYLPSDLTYRQIAEELEVGHETVRTQARAVIRKLGAVDRRSACRVAAERGLL